LVDVATYHHTVEYAVNEATKQNALLAHAIASIQSDANGRTSSIKHPFFKNEILHPKHTNHDGHCCTSCHQFEPLK